MPPDLCRLYQKGIYITAQGKKKASMSKRKSKAKPRLPEEGSTPAHPSVVADGAGGVSPSSNTGTACSIPPTAGAIPNRWRSMLWFGLISVAAVILIVLPYPLARTAGYAVLVLNASVFALQDTIRLRGILLALFLLAYVFSPYWIVPPLGVFAPWGPIAGLCFLAVLWAYYHAPRQAEPVAEKLKATRGIKDVPDRFGGFARRVVTLKNAVTYAGIVIALLVALAGVFIVHHTVRLALYARCSCG